MHFFSVKRLQFVDLVTRHGTFAKLNLSVPVENVLHTANELEKAGYNYESTISFTQEKFMFTTELLTEHGLCVSTNLALADDMFHMDKVSFDLYHEYSSLYYPTESFVTIPRTLFGNELFIMKIESKKGFNEGLVNGIFDANFVYFHDPYELPMTFLKPVSLSRTNRIDFTVEYKLLAVDESLHSMEPKE